MQRPFDLVSVPVYGLVFCHTGITCCNTELAGFCVFLPGRNPSFVLRFCAAPEFRQLYQVRTVVNMCIVCISPMQARMRTYDCLNGVRSLTYCMPLMWLRCNLTALECWWQTWVAAIQVSLAFKLSAHHELIALLYLLCLTVR